MLIQGGPGRGASLGGFKRGEITKGDIDDWLFEKNIEEAIMTRGILQLHPKNVLRRSGSAASRNRWDHRHDTALLISRQYPDAVAHPPVPIKYAGR
jgi:hypothetical protein